MDEQREPTGRGGDVATGKSMDEALRESEARLSAIVETAVDAIITIDERGTIESINTAGERMFGYTAVDLVGTNVSCLMPLPYQAEHDAYITKYLDTGEAKIIGIGREAVGLHKDGTVFPIDLAVSDVQFPDRRIFTGIVRDISERKRVEAELQRYRDRLETMVEEALAEVKSLSGLLPICSSCRNVRDDRGYWQQIEAYLEAHAETRFSHGLCPTCAAKLYPDLDLSDDADGT